jgi:hypothetical protein
MLFQARSFPGLWDTLCPAGTWSTRQRLYSEAQVLNCLWSLAPRPMNLRPTHPSVCLWPSLTICIRNPHSKSRLTMGKPSKEPQSFEDMAAEAAFDPTDDAVSDLTASFPVFPSIPGCSDEHLPRIEVPWSPFRGRSLVVQADWRLPTWIADWATVGKGMRAASSAHLGPSQGDQNNLVPVKKLCLMRNSDDAMFVVRFSHTIQGDYYLHTPSIFEKANIDNCLHDQCM